VRDARMTKICGLPGARIWRRGRARLLDLDLAGATTLPRTVALALHKGPA